MVLFPEARRALEHAAAERPVWEDGYDVPAARAEATAAGLAERREEVAAVIDLDADGVPCRLYRPAAAEVTTADGLVLHLHGGGFVFNDVDTVLAWLARRPDLGEAGPPIAGPLYAHGDSAGGNLALVAALRNPGRFRAVALIYPFLDPEAGFESYRTAADGFVPREAEWYWQQYAGPTADLRDPDLAPLLSDRLGTLPPTLVVTAEHDPLRDEGEHLALLLAEAGVEVVSTRYQGQVHGFWRHVEVFPAAEALVRQVAGFLRMHP